MTLTYDVCGTPIVASYVVQERIARRIRTDWRRINRLIRVKRRQPRQGQRTYRYAIVHDEQPGHLLLQLDSIRELEIVWSDRVKAPDIRFRFAVQASE